MKRIISLVLAALIILSFASCSPAEKKTNEPEKVALENVYLTEKIALPENSDIYNMCVSGDNVYFRGSKNETIVDENGNEEYKYTEVVYASDKSLSDFREFYSYEGENYWNEETMESRSTYFDNFYSDGRGGIWVSISSYYNAPADEEMTEWINDNNTILYHLTADGTTDREVNCKEAMKLGAQNTAEDVITNFYVSNLAEAKDGTLYILTNSAVVTVMTDGTVKIKDFGDNKNAANIAALENGNVRIICYDWSNDEYKADVINYEPISDKTETLCTLSSDNSIMLDSVGNVYVDDYYVVSRIDTATGEAVPMLDWINSDINCDKIFQTSVHNGELYTFEWDDNYENRSLLHLTPVGEGEIIEKYVITLAANTISSNIKNMIIDYNRTSAEYRIQVKAYGWEDSDTDRFDMDILAGNVPDIICLDQLNAEKYASKGILADLGALLDADGELSREDFLPNVLDAASINGKLYRLPTSFSVRSVIGKRSVLGDKGSWTWADFLSLMKQYPNAEMFSEFARETIWEGILPIIIEDFIDYDAGKANFTDGNFANFLEYAKSLPATIDWNTFYENIDWEEYEKRYQNDLALLMISYLSTADGDYYSIDTFGEPITFIGFPTSSGNGNAISFSSQFAIGEKSVYKEQAWDFMKMVFDEEYQTEFVWDIPVIKTAFDNLKQNAIDSVNGMNDEKDYPVFDDMEVMPYVEEAVAEEPLVEEIVEEVTDVEVSEDSFIAGKPVIGLPRPTPGAESDEDTKAKMLEHIEMVSQVITSANRLIRQNDPMIQIIKDECQPYFDGKKPLAETCSIIESRVNLYLAENM